MPKVSVIVPNYNHAPYLKQRFDSIFNQTFQDFEVIILDDCSTDNSKEIIEEYRNKPQVSHIVYNETNSGSPFKQWAKGFKLVKGEYIWIAESDDWAEPSFLEKLVPILNANISITLTFCNSLFEYESRRNEKKIFDASKELSGKTLLKKYFAHENVISNASSAIFRAKTILSITTDYQDFFGSGDYLFWIHIAEQGNFYYLNDCLNHFRQHNFNTTTINKKNGGLYKENLKIHHYLRKKKYISFFEKQVIVLNYLNRIDNDIKIFKSPPSSLQNARILWKKEILSEYLSKKIVKWGLWIWNIFH